MPVHDWKRVPSGIFHDFHHGWLWAIRAALNARLPKDYYALAEQITTGKFGPDVLTLTTKHDRPDRGGTAVATPPKPKPKTAFVQTATGDLFRRKQKSVVIKHVSDDRIVSVVEVLSPGNKSNAVAFEELVSKAVTLLGRDIHLSLIDVFPPTGRDPHGVHGAIWAELMGEPAELPRDRPLHAVSYERDESTVAYVEPFSVGDDLPDIPVFLEPGEYVDLSLEATYMEVFEALPERWRRELEGTKS